MTQTHEGPSLARGGPRRVLRSGDYSIFDNNVVPVVPQSKSCPPQPDKAAAATFLHWLDPEAEQFTYQTFDDKDKRESPELTEVLHGSIDECWPRLTYLSRRGAGAFITVNQTNLKGRAATDIVRVRALFCDLDGAPLANIMRVPLSLGWITRSSLGRYYGFWKVYGVTLGEFRALQKEIIRLTGGDPKIHDLPRVLRIPGLAHQKKAPRLVDGMAVGAQSAVNGRDACLAILPPPTPPPPAPMPTNRPLVRLGNCAGANRRYALKALESEAAYVETAPSGMRNDTLNRAAFSAGTLVEHGGISAAEIETVLTAAAQRAGLHDNEIKLTLASGLRAGMTNPRRIGAGK